VDLDFFHFSLSPQPSTPFLQLKTEKQEYGKIKKGWWGWVSIKARGQVVREFSPSRPLVS
jgi:hypothetical protein